MSSLTCKTGREGLETQTLYIHRFVGSKLGEFVGSDRDGLGVAI